MSGIQRQGRERELILAPSAVSPFVQVKSGGAAIGPGLDERLKAEEVGV